MSIELANSEKTKASMEQITINDNKSYCSYTLQIDNNIYNNNMMKNQFPITTIK